MDFKVVYLSSKYENPSMRLYTPEDKQPSLNKRVLCLSKYGVLRQDVFNPDFDIEWCHFPMRSGNFG